MLRKAKYKRFALLALSKQLSLSSTSGTGTPVAQALLLSTGVEMTHTHSCLKIIKPTTEVIISGGRCSIRDAGWHFPCTHAAGRRVEPKTHRKKCLCGLSAAWPHHSHHLTIPLLPHQLLPAFIFQSSFILELWDAHGRECALMHFCSSGYRQQTKTQLFPSPSPEYSWLWHPSIYQCSSREKIQELFK